ncbi:GNAT family N-acetyltransferase [Saccharothrix luteola]|uniref:GNAT family N-acetyltransferase n=1 Tax=Saccharothrix luteola TaxID=2893018 RepID=UPI001E651616|nr:GNAT family N-acetyltransferase [Saccharothrix luteola]MCC8251337.1 GNAT family N-acetyltransferase [Saccharothrix luteola]
MAEVTRHDDLAEFWALTGDFFNADPVFHTIPIAAVDRRLNHADPADEPPLLVSVSEDGVLVAAALRTPPWPLTLSGVAPEWADVVADALAGDVELPGVNGPRESVEAFVVAWAARTGCNAREHMALRLYELGDLVMPDVPGTPRLATVDDIDLLSHWRTEFGVEATEQVRDEDSEDRSRSMLRISLAAGHGHLIWHVGDTPVAWAAANAPASGMSRIGPVYTPPEHRRHGYGAAVTAACASWARENGAEHVVLYTDLSNPTSNSIYQRIGFRPVIDSAEFVFTPAGD